MKLIDYMGNKDHIGRPPHFFLKEARGFYRKKPRVQRVAKRSFIRFNLKLIQATHVRIGAKPIAHSDWSAEKGSISPNGRIHTPERICSKKRRSFFLQKSSV